MNEAPDDFQKAVFLQNFFPEISGFIAVWIYGIARPVMIAFIKRQKACFCTVELGR